MSQFLYVHDCFESPVTTTDYTEIIASSTDSCSYVQFFYFKTDASFGLVSLAIGDVSEEVDMVVCSQKVGTPIDCLVEYQSRFSIKAIGNNVSDGYIILCLLP